MRCPPPEVDGRGDSTRGTRGSAPGPRHDGETISFGTLEPITPIIATWAHRHSVLVLYVMTRSTATSDTAALGSPAQSQLPWLSRSPQTATRHNPLNARPKVVRSWVMDRWANQ